MTKLRENYEGLLEVLTQFWGAYGGWGSLFRSPYLHVSFALTLLMWNAWTNASWWDSVLSTLPNMLGFTLGGYAILIGFGDEQFKAIISGSDKKEQESPFLGTSAAFAHFIIVQLLALISALLAKFLYFIPEPNSVAAKIVGSIPFWNKMLDFSVPVSWFVGYWIFLYSLSLALAATLAVFRMSYWFDQYQSIKNSPSDEESNKIQPPNQNP